MTRSVYSPLLTAQPISFTEWKHIKVTYVKAGDHIATIETPAQANVDRSLRTHFRSMAPLCIVAMSLKVDPIGH